MEKKKKKGCCKRGYAPRLSKGSALSLSKGFTLIELLVVIAIIGVLATIVLVSLNTARAKARDTQRVADVRQVQSALEMYFDANGSYPTTLNDLVTAGFLSSVPIDPTSSSTLRYAYGTSGGARTSYHLGSYNVLEKTDEGNGVLATDKDCNSTSGTGCPTGYTWAGGTFDGSDGEYDVTP